MNESEQHIQTTLSLTAEEVAELAPLAEQTAQPEAVYNRLLRVIGEHAAGSEKLKGVTLACQDPLWRKRLVYALGNSPYLTRVLGRWPEFLLELIEGNVESDPQIIKERLVAQVMGVNSQMEVAALLRRQKHRQFLRIALLDLTEEATLKETTLGLTAVADASLEAAFCWSWYRLAQKHGSPLLQTAEGEIPAHFVILGMGKLGAWELNFSSDVDVIFLYDHENGSTNGSRPLSAKQFFSLLAREVMRLLQDLTADGMVFRVDARLRPEGESGELCLSTTAALTYYESWGQTWERAAMIKARPVAGHLPLGNDFLLSLKPFVYRRYLDFTALDAIREMKHKIDHKMNKLQNYHHNVKLGYGGIREIEFFAQVLQLIHGGKNPKLRLRETIPTIEALEKQGLIDAKTAQTLCQGYTFLRQVEHRLQIIEEQQVHCLPQDPAEFFLLARRLGIADSETLKGKIKQVTSSVHQIYSNLFFDGERHRPQKRDPLVEKLMECEQNFHTQTCLSFLTEAGFQNPEQAMEWLAILRDGPRKTSLTEKMRLWIHRLFPLLLHEILQAPDPDMALQNAQAFLMQVGTRSSYLALLVEHPHVIRLLARLFGSSTLLSKFLVQHPVLLDNLTTRDFLEHYRGRSDLHRLLSERLQLVQEMARTSNPASLQEERFRVIREFKNTEVLRIGIRDLSQIAEPSEVVSGLSSLADTILTHILTDALDELTVQHGSPCWTDTHGQRHLAHFAILAMGKLGGSELNYSSDLDLIFVHDSQGEQQWTDGEKSLTNTVFFNKLGRKIIIAITTLTENGKLYELDMRLRPSGQSGPLVTSLESFCQYQHASAWLWEHQALTRARVAVGEPELTGRLKEAIQTILCQKRSIERVRQEVLEMRLRMFQEKKPKEGILDIKQSRGGIVDIEFLVQFLLLAYANQYPKILRPNLSEALYALLRQNLLSETEYQTLEEAYRFYLLTENRLRLLHGHSTNQIDLNSQDPIRLARLYEMNHNEELVGVLKQHFAAVQPIFERFFITP
ncbi:MAG: bifunctional [glutamate--ammonia ligase]-adenylyl-L-tyrosine phosphorylase/[glutamate--ammonia-ligase] adenylyltransferase [Magnetococcus sp. DMHC-6]